MLYQMELFTSELTRKILCMDCIQCMREMEDESVDLVITSPPYAMRRKDTYGGIGLDVFPDWMCEVTHEIHRILKPTGNFVFNISDIKENGIVTGYVYETIGKMANILQWRDTFIWAKANPFPTGTKRRLKAGFEYLYWFTKTKEYKFFPDAVLVPSSNKFLEKEKRRKNKGAHRCNNRSGMDMSKRYISDMVRPSTVIMLPTDNSNHYHPATFPVSLPSFFIKLMTEEKDVVFDPFMGSGSSLLAAKRLYRQYIGCDIKEEYVEIARNRLKNFEEE